MKKGVIAFIDVLGVKGLWARTNPKEFMRSWKQVLRLFSASRKAMLKVYGFSGKQTSIRAFSDTIIITFTTKDNPVDYILFMGDLLMFPFFGAIDMGIYLRGVINIGEFEISDTIILGPAIDEAAEWYTKPDWFGISLTPSASFGLEQLIDKGVDHSKIFIEYDIPMKTGVENVKSFALNWPHNFVSFIKHHGRTENLGRSALLESFSKGQIIVETYKKYKNTIAFWDYVMGDKKIKVKTLNN
jgi:hypothetical protein